MPLDCAHIYADVKRGAEEVEDTEEVDAEYGYEGVKGVGGDKIEEGEEEIEETIVVKGWCYERRPSGIFLWILQ